MREVTIGLQDHQYEALEDAAANAHISVPEYAALLLVDQLETSGFSASQDKVTLIWQAEDLLQALDGFGARPGGSVPIQSLSSIWFKMGGTGRTGENLIAGANNLVELGLAESDCTSLTLNDAGYRHMRGG